VVQCAELAVMRIPWPEGGAELESG